MATLEQLLAVISDPYDSREEGVDFWIDEQGYIQTHDVRTAALLMRKANSSGEFEQNLVKIAQKGDSIILGFDTVVDTDPVFVSQIGYQKSVLAEVKVDTNGKFCIYLDGKRSARMFAKLASAKTFVKRLDRDLQTVGNTVATYEESED